MACDESGSEGEKLIGGATDVFCHVSVRLSFDEGAECLRELRAMVRSPAVEYKAFHLQRDRSRHALEWLIGSLRGRVNAFLVDKTYLLLLAFADRLGLDVAPRLYRAHRTSTPFLEALNSLMRWGPVGDGASTDVLVEAAPPDVLALLNGHRLDALRAVDRPDPTLPFALDQLMPAILRAIDHWGGDGTPVSVVHDSHKALTDSRMEQIAALRDGSCPGGRLAAMRLVRAGDDARIQIADILAGVARRAVSEELAGAGDRRLTTLLRDFVDPHSVWCDEPSWARIRGTA